MLGERLTAQRSLAYIAYIVECESKELLEAFATVDAFTAVLTRLQTSKCCMQ